MTGISAARSLKAEKKSETAAHAKKNTHSRLHRITHRHHGQQAIEASRVREIQAALIREHYLTGEANGVWDARTQGAMQRYQADNGWQTKKIPDSRAIIKLGLGPSHADLINPDTASLGLVTTGKGGSQD
jgi:peptidoglycan hydrolase-like protein with peptidoglycan-binding domain